MHDERTRGSRRSGALHTAQHIARWAVLALLVGHAAGAETAPPGDALRGGTPRAAMRGYLEASRAGDYEGAARYLDLRFLSPVQGARQGPELARQLKVALDRSLWVDLDALSDEADGQQEDGLPARQDLVGTVESQQGPVDVLLERVPGSAPPLWRVAASTLRSVPELYESFGPSALEEWMPQALRESRWLELAPWQWIGVLVLAVASASVAFVLVFVVLRVARRLLHSGAVGLDSEVLSLVRWPLHLALGVALFAATLDLLSLPLLAERIARGAARGVGVGAAAWLTLRIVDGVARQMEERFRLHGKLPAAAAVPLVRRVTKALLLLIAAIAVAGNLGVDVTGLVAGLGIGGLAVALAAQKTVENLFGGLTLITDQPVRAGDFCRAGDWVGTVEDVGMRSTRMRTLDRTLVTIPNAAIAAMELENFARRDRIFFHPILNLRYETTPDQLRWLLVELKRLLVSHPMVSPDPARVRFVALGAHSLDVEIFAYVRTTDYDEFLAVQEDLLLRIMDLVEQSGTGFAFPSQTLYAAPDPGLDAKRQQAAVEQVQAWRERRELPLPWPPGVRPDAWQGSCDDPPKAFAAAPARRA